MGDVNLTNMSVRACRTQLYESNLTVLLYVLKFLSQLSEALESRQSSISLHDRLTCGGAAGGARVPAELRWRRGCGLLCWPVAALLWLQAAAAGSA